MASLEQVEKLREKANVSFEEAKAALDASNGDLLDALIYLEKQGKVNAPVGGGYYSSQNSNSTQTNQNGESQPCHERYGESFGDMLKRFFRFCAKLIHKGNTNYFEAEKNGETVISCPVTAMVLLLIFLFWVIVPLVLIGLFFGFRYRFRGRELGKESVNRVMDSASNAAEDLKKSFNDKK
jgi:flagellar hook-basal body complex protein FliE